MERWVKRARGAVGMGLTWAAGWFGVGMAIELVHNIWPNPVGSLVDIWPAALALPAFLGGLGFSLVLGVAGRRRRFDELSLARFATWGAAAGLVLSLVPATFAVVGAVSAMEAVATGAAITLLSGASASGTLLLARFAEDRELADAGSEVADVGLSETEARKLLGG